MHFNLCRTNSILFSVLWLGLVFVGAVNVSKASDELQHNAIGMERPQTWLKSAQQMIGSPTGHVVVQMAKELLNRSTGNSQVLSLNLTNLLIILLLKILIFTAGMLGAGHWSNGGGYGYGGYARSADAGVSFGLNDGESHLVTGFLTSQGIGIDDCLYAAACASPHMAYEYAKAARALIAGIEKFNSQPMLNARYNDLIVLMEKAAYDGYSGAACNTTIQCTA